MELHLGPIIPVTRVVNGHNVFNKGYRHGLRGKTYEEYYGEERAKEIRKRHSEELKGHPYWSNRRAAAKSCVVIHQGKLLGRFDSVIDASMSLGINYATARRYLKGRIRQLVKQEMYEDAARLKKVIDEELKEIERFMKDKDYS